LTFLGDIFQTQTQTMDCLPDLSHKKLNRPDPGQNFLTQTHHYLPPSHFFKYTEWVADNLSSIQLTGKIAVVGTILGVNHSIGKLWYLLRQFDEKGTFNF